MRTWGVGFNSKVTGVPMGPVPTFLGIAGLGGVIRAPPLAPEQIELAGLFGKGDQAGTHATCCAR